MRSVVLLTIDALRQDALGCYGNGLGLTPFIDSLAARSLVFTQAHAVAPYTQASFPGILTSSYYYDCPVSEHLSSQRTLVSEVLQAAGICTAAFHSNPYLCDYFGWNRGWHHFYDSMEDEVTALNPYAKGDAINRHLDDWLAGQAQGRDRDPLFLWVHYMDVHEPYVPDRRYLEAVDPSIRLSPQQMFDLFVNVVRPRDVSDPSTVRLLHQLYLAHVREVDGYVRDLWHILERRGVLVDTTVIITSDHGDEFGEHGGLSHDGKMYSELVRVPLLIYRSGEQTGQACHTVVSGLDISPTIVHLFGLEAVERFQGHSLLPLGQHPRRGCYGEALGKLTHRPKPTDRPAFYYREGDLKIMYRAEEDRWEMYDLGSDPGEHRNIIDTSPMAGEMKRKLQPRIDRVSVRSSTTCVGGTRDAKG